MTAIQFENIKNIRSITMYEDRIRHPGLLSKIMSADEAAKLFHNGMRVGMSGFTRAGDAKALPRALAERALQDPLSLTLITGASLGNGSDGRGGRAGAPHAVPGRSRLARQDQQR